MPDLSAALTKLLEYYPRVLTSAEVANWFLSEMFDLAKDEAEIRTLHSELPIEVQREVIVLADRVGEMGYKWLPPRVGPGGPVRKFDPQRLVWIIETLNLPVDLRKLAD